MWIGTAGLSFTAVPRVSFLYLNYPTVTTCTQDLLDPEHMKDLSSQKGGCVCACVCVCVCAGVTSGVTRLHYWGFRPVGAYSRHSN